MRVHYRSCDVGLINKPFFFGSDIINKSDFFTKPVSQQTTGGEDYQ